MHIKKSLLSWDLFAVIATWLIPIESELLREVKHDFDSMIPETHLAILSAGQRAHNLAMTLE